MRTLRIPHIRPLPQGYIHHDQPTDLSNCWNWSPRSVILVKVTVGGGQRSSSQQTDGGERNNRNLKAAMIRATLCTFTENLYLISSDVPFVFVCAWTVQRSHGAKRRENKEIINGDQCPCERRLSYLNGSTPQTAVKTNRQEFSHWIVFVNSFCHSQRVSVCPLWGLIVHLQEKIKWLLAISFTFFSLLVRSGRLSWGKKKF